jgi:hypothetical protein
MTTERIELPFLFQTKDRTLQPLLQEVKEAMEKQFPVSQQHNPTLPFATELRYFVVRNVRALTGRGNGHMDRGELCRWARCTATNKTLNARLATRAKDDAVAVHVRSLVCLSAILLFPHSSRREFTDAEINRYLRDQLTQLPPELINDTEMGNGDPVVTYARKLLSAVKEIQRAWIGA